METKDISAEVRAALLAKFRFSRKKWEDLELAPMMENVILNGDDVKTPGFTYLDSGLYIYGSSPHTLNPDGDRFWLDICNEGWEEPATEAGLAAQEERLFEWALSEGFFDEDLNPTPPQKEGDDTDFFYWTVRIGVHKSWVADGWDLADDDEAHERLRAVVPCCDGSEFQAHVVETPLKEAILKEQGYTGEELAKALELRGTKPVAESEEVVS